MVTGGQAIRGTRVGSGPMGEMERGESAAATEVFYHCCNGHATPVRFSAEVSDGLPEEWDCVRCGLPAGRDGANPPAAPSIKPYKTHLAYVQERRDEAAGEALLGEALTRLREQRGTA
ncbi:RNA polymerase-binding protein RbpA [Kytococcus sp. Marseille-QA3725]